MDFELTNEHTERVRNIEQYINIHLSIFNTDFALFSMHATAVPDESVYDQEQHQISPHTLKYIYTVCPSDPFYTVTYYIKWVTTSWTYSTSYQGCGPGWVLPEFDLRENLIRLRI